MRLPRFYRVLHSQIIILVNFYPKICITKAVLSNLKSHGNHNFLISGLLINAAEWLGKEATNCPKYFFGDEMKLGFFSKSTGIPLWSNSSFDFTWRLAKWKVPIFYPVNLHFCGEILAVSSKNRLGVQFLRKFKRARRVTGAIGCVCRDFIVSYTLK